MQNQNHNCSSKNIQVLVAYHVFPHYRLPVMRELAHDQDVHYTFLSGNAFDLSIPTVSAQNTPDTSFQWINVRNIWLFNGRLLWQAGLIRECLRRDYDCVIFLGNPYFLSTWLAAFLSRLRGKKVFYWAHATVRNKLRDVFKILFYRIAHGLLLYGNQAKDKLTALGFNPSSIFVVYNSLDYQAQSKLREKTNPVQLAQRRRELFAHPEAPILLFIGRLTGNKRLDYLVNAGAELHRHGLPVNILFVGEGPERDKLDELVKHNNLNPFVTFYGACYEEDEISRLIAISDLCVSPGDVGLTAVHSLSYGTPVITHDNPLMQNPEFEAIQPGVTGLLYEYGSLESLVNSIQTWLELNHNNREQIRTRCYEVIDKYYNPAYQASTIKSAIYQMLGLHP